jgi:hypothetical protein
MGISSILAFFRRSKVNEPISRTDDLEQPFDVLVKREHTFPPELWPPSRCICRRQS